MNKNRYGLLVKFGISLSVLMIFVSSLLTFFLVLNERIRISSDLKDVGLTMAKNLADNCEQGVLKKEKRQIYRSILNVARNNDVVFIHVLDAKGSMLAKLEKQNMIKPSIFNINIPIETFGNEPGKEDKTKHPKIIGQVILGISLDKVNDIINHIFQVVLGITSGVVLFGIFGVYLLVTYFLTKPLRRFVVGTRKISEGDLSHRINIEGNDEIGELAKSFNQMAIELQRSTEEIKNHSKILEEMVTKRTQELSDALEKLRFIDKMKTEFLSVTSHELKTPLIPIHEFTALLSDQILGPLNDAQKRALSTIKRQSEHLDNLINNVLDITRLETGKPFPVKKKLISLEDIINEVEEAIIPKIKLAELMFEKYIPRNLPTIYADPSSTRRLFDNLLDNAIKFTPKGGKIALSISLPPGFVRVSVSDTGIGISKENLKRIFEKFFQADSSYSREAGGLGMGLAIAKGIVEAHGGKIWVESKGLGWGTTIYFQIPVE